MCELKVVENGLVVVYEDAQQRTVVNARELHAFLESKRQFANWIQDRIEKYGFTDGEDYTSFNEIVKRENGGGTTRTEYLLTMDTAKEIAMVENNEKGRQVRRYFIECEKRLFAKAKFEHQGNMEDGYWPKRHEVARLLLNMAYEYAGVLSQSDSRKLIGLVVTLLTEEITEVEPVETGPLYSAGELGKMFGVSAYVIGTIANKAKIKTSTYGTWVFGFNRYKGEKQSTFKYNEAGKERIGQIIRNGI